VYRTLRIHWVDPQESVRCLARVPDFMTTGNARAVDLATVGRGQLPVPTPLIVLPPAPLPEGCFVRGAHCSVGRYIPIYKNIAVVNSPHSYSNITSAPATCRNIIKFEVPFCRPEAGMRERKKKSAMSLPLGGTSHVAHCLTVEKRKPLKKPKEHVSRQNCGNGSSPADTPQNAHAKAKAAGLSLGKSLTPRREAPILLQLDDTEALWQVRPPEAISKCSAHVKLPLLGEVRPRCGQTACRSTVAGRVVGCTILGKPTCWVWTPAA